MRRTGFFLGHSADSIKKESIPLQKVDDRKSNSMSPGTISGYEADKSPSAKSSASSFIIHEDSDQVSSLSSSLSITPPGASLTPTARLVIKPDTSMQELSKKFRRCTDPENVSSKPVYRGLYVGSVDGFEAWQRLQRVFNTACEEGLIEEDAKEEMLEEGSLGSVINRLSNMK